MATLASSRHRLKDVPPLLFTLAQFACTSKVTAEIHETCNFILYVVLYTEENQTLVNLLNSLW